MLVLSRRKKEEILFPGLEIAVRVLDVKGQSVRIGIDAPREVKVVRGEIAGLQSPTDEPASKERALLVEDDANERELLASLLRMHGFDVDTANDGDEALSYLSSHRRPDVVLLDMLMPNCDGPTTVSTIRSDPSFEGLKVFAVSGTRPNHFGVPEGPTGCDRWFPKPVDPAQLICAMKR